MQKLDLIQRTRQRLSAQQIQAIGLLQLSSDQMQERIAKELEENPVLEQEKEVSDDEVRQLYEEAVGGGSGVVQQKGGYGMVDREWRDRLVPSEEVWRESFLHQLACLSLSDIDYRIGEYIIGSVDRDGYMRKSVEGIVDDMEVFYDIKIEVGRVEGVLHKLQRSLEPVGVVARSVQECLVLQLERREGTPVVEMAINILKDYFILFSKRHYKKIRERLGMPRLSLFKEVLDVITRLTPSPLGVQEASPLEAVSPDFIIRLDEGVVRVALAKEYLPSLRVNRRYASLLRAKGGSDEDRQETLRFMKRHIMRAQWFMEAISQRKKTLLRTMQAIVDLQEVFFKEGNERVLKPIFLRDVADRIGMDVSTVSRVVSKKRVQTPWGVYALKYFFSEPISTTSGGQVSSRIVKQALRELMAGEDKCSPYSDSMLEKKLREQGYIVARRTVAKYREQLKLPIARLRKRL